jgi:hypothetical protein
MLLSGLGPAPPTYHLLPIRVLAERREIALHAPRLQFQGPGANLQRGRGDETVDDLLRDE